MRLMQSLIAATRPFSPYCVRSVGRRLDRDAADPGRAGSVGGRLRHRRSGAAAPVQPDHAMARRRLLEVGHRPHPHALRRDRERVPDSARRRASPDRRAITASTAILMCVRNEAPDRVLRNLDTMMGDLDAEGWAARFHVYILSDTSQADMAAAEQQAFDALGAQMGRPLRRHLSPPRGQHRLQGRQHPRLPRALGRPPRLHGHARCRQLHDGGRHPAPGRHHAARSQARHPAEPGDRHADDQRLRAAVPVRHASRHALVDDRQRLVAGRLRAVLGPQRHHPRGAVQGSIAPSRRSPARAS